MYSHDKTFQIRQVVRMRRVVLLLIQCRRLQLYWRILYTRTLPYRLLLEAILLEIREGTVKDSRQVLLSDLESERVQKALDQFNELIPSCRVDIRVQGLREVCDEFVSGSTAAGFFILELLTTPVDIIDVLLPISVRNS